MPLTPRESFKVAFMARAIEAGNTTPTALLSVVKEAEDRLLRAEQAMVKQAFGGGAMVAASNIARPILDTIRGYGIPALALGPAVAGGLGGYGLAKATDVDEADVDEVKDRELRDTYHTEAAKLRRQKAVRDYNKLRARTGRIFM